MKSIKFEDSGLLGYDTMLLGKWFLVSFLGFEDEDIELFKDDGILSSITVLYPT
jgi:hypothetical protein